MEHKNSFHIKKLNHQSGFGWAEMMRAGYVWLAALLCFIWYAADRFEMDTAGVALFIGAAFFILLYFVGISVGKGFTVFISGLYFFVPFFILSMENIRRALLIFSRTVFDYLADYGQSKNIFHRIIQNTSVDMQTGNVEFFPFVVGILGITLWLILFMALLWKVQPCILFFTVAICFAFPKAFSALQNDTLLYFRKILYYEAIIKIRMPPGQKLQAYSCLSQKYSSYLYLLSNNYSHKLFQQILSDNNCFSYKYLL